VKSRWTKHKLGGILMGQVKAMIPFVVWEASFISQTRYIQFKVNSGKGTNNLGEFMALKYLLKIALEKGQAQL
jgi:hypothetical protein